MKPLKILYFIAGSAPTSKDLAEAQLLNGNVCFRNASAIVAGASIETCGAVAGLVPKDYKELPTAEEALAKREEAAKAELERLSEVEKQKPPKKAKKDDDKGDKGDKGDGKGEGWGKGDS